jgi:hypothetical protein
MVKALINTEFSLDCRLADCWALAASGQVAAVPPSSVMNSRRCS